MEKVKIKYLDMLSDEQILKIIQKCGFKIEENSQPYSGTIIQKNNFIYNLESWKGYDKNMGDNSCKMQINDFYISSFEYSNNNILHNANNSETKKISLKLRKQLFKLFGNEYLKDFKLYQESMKKLKVEELEGEIMEIRNQIDLIKSKEIFDGIEGQEFLLK